MKGGLGIVGAADARHEPQAWQMKDLLLLSTGTKAAIQVLGQSSHEVCR